MKIELYKGIDKARKLLALFQEATSKLFLPSSIRMICLEEGIRIDMFILH
ncbi:hypothetical protein ES702_04385 [subsurface metagenome]